MSLLGKAMGTESHDMQPTAIWPESPIGPWRAEIPGKAASEMSTATYMRLWEAFLQLRNWASVSPFSARNARASAPSHAHVPWSHEYRRRVREAIAQLVNMGIQKGELVSGLDKDQAADQFLQLCSQGDGPVSCLQGESATAAFDRFWHGIASNRNSRHRNTVPEPPSEVRFELRPR